MQKIQTFFFFFTLNYLILCIILIIKALQVDNLCVYLYCQFGEVTYAKIGAFFAL